MNKPPLRVRIKHDLWTKVGERTLMGLYTEASLADTRKPEGGYDKSLAKHDHSKLVLEIEQTSYGYRRDNGGPVQMITTEFMPLCLIRDVLSMIHKHNIDIQVEVVDIHHEPELD